TDEVFYLSSNGYLIKLNLENVSETGQLPAGLMPWGAASCDGHIYFTDFGSDQLFDFNPKDKALNKVNLNKIFLGTQSIELYTKPVDETIKKTPIQKTFEKVFKPKAEPEKYNPLSEPLEIAKHNKKLGAGSVSCNQNYVFVVGTLTQHVDVLDREKLETVASFKVGERPSHVAISPDGKLIAITSTALNKVFIANANGDFSKKTEIDVLEGPTQIEWFNNNLLWVVNRGDGSISLLNNSSASVEQTLKLDNALVNTIKVSPEENKIYALDGTNKNLFAIDTQKFTFKTSSINEKLKFPNLLSVVGEHELLIASEPDGKILILNTQTLEPIKKIQTNLPPKAIVKLVEEVQYAQIPKSAPKTTLEKNKITNPLEKKTEVETNSLSGPEFTTN
ncbi:MAG TPA: YncE family protein, partial [Vampirovibrionales bacterium]